MLFSPNWWCTYFFQVIAFLTFLCEMIEKRNCNKISDFNKLVGILMSHLFSISIDDHFDINISVKIQL